MGHTYRTMHFFCEEPSLCERGHSFYRDGVDRSVFCFAEREDAEKFHGRFGGDHHATELTGSTDAAKRPLRSGAVL